MEDFYRRLKKFKKDNSLTYSELGKLISVGGDTIRMAMKNQSFSEIRKERFDEIMSAEINSSSEKETLIEVFDKKHLSLDEIAVIVAKNENALMEKKIFSNIVEIRVAKRVAEITSSIDTLKEYLNISK